MDTAIVARGIDVDVISPLVHVNAPADHEDYLHRFGVHHARANLVLL